MDKVHFHCWASQYRVIYSQQTFCCRFKGRNGVVWSSGSGLQTTDHLFFVVISSFSNWRRNTTTKRLVSLGASRTWRDKFLIFGCRYCYGGSTCVRLASRPDLFKSTVVCHPGGFAMKDLRKVKIPIAFACAEGTSSYFPSDNI